MEDSYDGYISRREILECCDRLDRIAVGTREEAETDNLITSTVVATTRAVRSFVWLAKEQDVVPVRHGRWMEHKSWAKCSECGYLIGFETTYCPNCGARMDGDGDV